MTPTFVEVRRGLEADVAALAAQRITPEKAKAIGEALNHLEACPPQGTDGVEADLAFHRSIARATDNPHFERLLGFLEQYQREAMRVTRTNEALDSGYMVQVRQEHRAIAEAVMRGDVAGARQAAMQHMHNAAHRIEYADPPIRRALGASTQGLVRVTLTGAARPATVGILVGSGLSLVLWVRVRELLFHPATSDLLALGVAAATILAATVVASIGPGTRVIRADPMDALRSE